MSKLADELYLYSHTPESVIKYANTYLAKYYRGDEKAFERLLQNEKSHLTTPEKTAKCLFRLLDSSDEVESVFAILLARLLIVCGVDILPYMGEIDDELFEKTSFESLNYTAKLDNCSSVGMTSFYDANLKQIVAPSLLEIGPGAFMFNKIETLELPNVRMVGTSAFEKCFDLKKIVLPNCSHLSYECFADCGDIEEVYLPKLKTMEEAPFRYTQIKKMVLSSKFSMDLFVLCQKLFGEDFTRKDTPPDEIRFV